jgi:hypothetical protein
MMSYKIVNLISKCCSEAENAGPNNATDNSSDSTHRSWGTVPIELKVLISLRKLGRGNVADDIAEMSGVPRVEYDGYHSHLDHE